MCVCVCVHSSLCVCLNKFIQKTRMLILLFCVSVLFQIKNAAKIKRMKKKALRKIEKR